MKVTEFDAMNNKRCPLPQNARCLGSVCMLWEWDDYEYVKPEKGTKEQRKNCLGWCGLLNTK